MKALPILLTVPVVTFVPWWLLMLMLGALHRDVFAWVPALGYWQTALVGAAVAVIGGIFSTGTSIRTRSRT